MERASSQSRAVLVEDMFAISVMASECEGWRKIVVKCVEDGSGEPARDR